MARSILVNEVTKSSRLGETNHAMIREAITRACQNLLRLRKAPSPSLKWALDGVSFEINRGDVVGIIGRNGAGKSTLLKILSRITYPTSGTVSVEGRVGSLLEVGTGFHDELTGRENIYMNGSILGMRKREIDAALDQIVAFADIDNFLDTPVKRYSSGMRMRLGFSVAAHLRTDVLFVDEVLAVGDVGFQKKCLGTIRQVGDGGRSVIFVSHNLAAVQNLCKRTIWIAEGKIRRDGPTEDVIRAYLTSLADGRSDGNDLRAISDRQGTGAVRLTRIELLTPAGRPLPTVHSGDALRVRLHYDCERDVPNLHFGVRIYSCLGTLVTDAHTWATGQPVPLAPRGSASIDLEIDFLNLMPGTYYFGVWVASPHEWHDLLDSAVKVDVEPSDYYGTGRGIESRFGLVFLPCRWRTDGGSAHSSSGHGESTSHRHESPQTNGTPAFSTTHPGL